MVLEMNGPQLHSANMLEEVEFYRALFELYEGGVVVLLEHRAICSLTVG